MKKVAMALTMITPTYRITIPKEIRKRYRLKPGQKVRFEVDGNALLLHFEEDAPKKPTKPSKDSDE